MSRNIKKNPWLDFLRASAILAVLVYHVGQAWPIDRPWLDFYTNIGKLGVDLFFVLSGWLIGGLFWQERRKNGKVDLMRFWMRRWWRTIPPYAGALLLAWLAVWFFRHEHFDPGYLLFIQNYYHAMPFFLVSWSLCIEEHFYLFIPLIFFLIKDHPWVYLLTLLGLPLLFRYIEYTPESMGFGYLLTATHLHCDGLILGFAAAYTNIYHRVLFVKIRPVFLMIAPLALLFLILDLGGEFEYIFNPLLVAIVFLGLLVSIVHNPKNNVFGNRIFSSLARISYSIYLIHALVIHAFIKIIYPYINTNELFALVLQIIFILFAGWIFHLIFERTSLSMRERWVPKYVKRYQ